MEISKLSIRNKIILSTITLFISMIAVSQNVTIKGKVTDDIGEIMTGVTVTVENQESQGTITDVDGNYTLNNVPPNASLKFSYVGMKTQTVPVNNRTRIDVVLLSDTELLDEVVVVGYGTQKKATLTGAVSSVKGKDLQMTPAINMTNRLTGKIPGLSTVQTSSVPGEDDPTIRIRGVNTTGNNSPLIVVDGIANRNLSRLDPVDIESITVLKDASAAIYGAQAANGVILITTKRGEAGKTKVTFTLNQGWSKPTSLPEMADAYTYMSMVNEENHYSGMSPTYSDEVLSIYKENKDRDPWLYPETDWYDAVYKPLSPETYGNVSVTGGMERFKYFISLGANYQEGIHRNSGNNYSQINFRSNIDGKISENIKINFDLSGRQSVTNRPADMYNPLYSHQLVVQSRPNMPARWPNGLPGPGVESDLNPVVSSSKDMGYDKFKSYVFGGLLKLDINIPFIRGLTLSGNLAVDKTFNNNKKWSIPYYLYYWGGYNENNEPQLIKTKHGVKQPELTQSMADAGSITLNGLINYNNTFKDHTVGALVGVERSTSDNMNFNASRKYFPSQEIDQLFAGGDFEKDNGGSASQSARLNYFGRVNYNYMSKYLAEFVFRYDGSYIFQKDYRFGFFPGVSLGWIVSGEKFWKENNPVTYLKLRGSWGQTGNDRISPYQYLATYGFRTDWKNKYIFNINEETTALKELRIPYEEITWEVANQTNIGIDMQMFHGKFSLTVEYFHNLRKKILEYRNASVPQSTGLTLPRENIGKVKNQGFEIQLNYNHMIGDFSFSISPNLSYATNKIIFWDETPNVEDYRKSTGRPIGAGLYYQAIGFFRDQAHIDSYPHLPSAKPGDIIFEDYNKDGKIDGLDQVRSKNSSVPKYFGGLNIDLGYRNFYASIFFQGAAGYDYYITMITGSPESNYYKFITENRWTEENNANASMPRAAILARGGRVYWSEQANTFFLRKGNYLRLKSMEVGYSIPKNMINKIGIKELNVYISGMNLFTLTKLPKGFDPERSNSTLWPLNKVYNVGFKLTF